MKKARKRIQVFMVGSDICEVDGELAASKIIGGYLRLDVKDEEGDMVRYLFSPHGMTFARVWYERGDK